MRSPQESLSSLHARFEAQADRTPENVAVEWNGIQLTYAELSRRSSVVAAQLAATLQHPGQLVGLFLERSADLIVGLLGILKAGGAYVPIDPGYPAERIRFLLADSGVSTVVTRSPDLGRLPGAHATVLVDGPEQATAEPLPRRAVAPSDAAYVIYTSGSTGTPKGTIVEHRNVTRLFDATEQWFGFGPSDVWTMFHSISFDFSVWEIWGALLHGGRLVIVPPDVVTVPGAFARLVEDSHVTVVNQTPTAFWHFARASLAARHAYTRLRTVIFGGERLEASHLRPWIEHYGADRPQLINMYGITETTVHVTYRPISAADLQHPERSPIGRPIGDLEVHLIDEHGAKSTPGCPGEIVVTGAGVSRGYLNRPELTAERFPMLPLGPGATPVRCYRSGDLAVVSDGELLYLGRSDDQVKIRGYRIELREVELRIEQCPGVERCAVIARDFGDGDVRLIAFLVVKPDCAEMAARVKEITARTLPAYMCPSHVVEIDELPRTTNGKLDRDALLQRLAHHLSDPGTSPAPPTAGSSLANTTVARVADLAQAILQHNISPELDLFDQGATSLSLVRLLLDVNLAFGLTLTGAELDGDSSVVNISAIVDRMAQHKTGSRLEDMR